MIDNKLTERIIAWLNVGQHTEREDIITGAMMLVQLNRNQAMFNTMMRRPEKYVDKIVYELKKFVPIRQENMTMADVKNMEDAVLPVIKSAIDKEKRAEEGSEDVQDLPSHGGKRSDHELLPEDIQNIWVENAERWKKIKKAYNTCLTLTEACDRFEYVKLMKESWYKYKAEFERYDSFVINAAHSSGADTSVDAVELVKQIDNARSYLSKNVNKLIKAKSAADAENADEKTKESYRNLLEKVEDRIQLLMKNNQVIGDDLRAKLIDGGIDGMWKISR